MCVIFKDRWEAVDMPFVGVVKFTFLAHFPVDFIAVPVVSSLIFSLLIMLLSLIKGLMILSLSLHSQHLLFCWVLSVLALIWFLHKALPYDAITRDSVSLLRFIFLSPVQTFSSEMVFISRVKRPWSCFFLISVSYLMSFYRLSCYWYRFWWM